MNIGLQTKLLCKFNDPVGDDYSGSNSIYQGQYTLWFKVEQHSSVIDDCDADGKNCVTSKSSMWTCALKDNEDGSSPGWNPPSESGVKACPFLFIYAGDGARCTDGDGDPTTLPSGQTPRPSCRGNKYTHCIPFRESLASILWALAKASRSEEYESRAPGRWK